jgi:Flp pilus assembly protein TadD
VELEQALKLNPGSLVANTLMALYWQRRGDDRRALEYQRLAAQAQPENPAVQVELGAALAYAGHYEDALQAYQGAVDLSPNEARYYKQLALFCIRYEYMLDEVGLPAARRAVALAPQDPETLDVMAQALTVQGDVPGARRFIERALEADPEYVPARLHLGLLLALDGDLEAARAEWDWVQASAAGTPEAAQAARLVENYFR